MHHNLDTELWNSFTQHSKAPVNPLTPTGTNIHLVLKEAVQWVLRGCLSYIRNMFWNTLWAVFSSLASLTLWRAGVNITDNLTHAVVCGDRVLGIVVDFNGYRRGIRYKISNTRYPEGLTFSDWTLRSNGQLQRMLAGLSPRRQTFCRDFSLQAAQVDPRLCFSVVHVSALRVVLAAEVMWNVREGGNTFFNTLIFGKHLSHLVSANNWPAGRGWMSFTQRSR